MNILTIMNTLTRSLAALAVLVLMFAADPALAQSTFLVTKTADTNDLTCDADCSLREAITAANADPLADRIEFAPAVQGQTIALDPAFGELTISRPTVIDAEGTDVTIAANGTHRVLRIIGDRNNNVDVTLRGLTITGGGSVQGGGGILLPFFASLRLEDATVIGNEARISGAGSNGGGISADGRLTIIGSTIVGNKAGLGGGVFTSGTARIERSTISGNAADGGGGLASDFYSRVTVVNTTFTDNVATSRGGGIWIFMDVLSTFGNSIITGNIAPTGADCYSVGGSSNGAIASTGFNVFGTGSDCPSGTGDVSVANASSVLEATLADNGGPTRTHALVMGSPAIDIGGTCGPTDQRGFATPADGDYDGTIACDAGSVEALVVNLPPVAVAAVENDLPVIAGETVALNGSGSSDPDDDPLTYAWTLDGPGYTSEALTGASPTFCAATDGVYTAILTVSDGDLSDSDEVEVTAVTVDEALNILITDVIALGPMPDGDGTLNNGQVRGLTVKLEQGQKLLDRGKTSGALDVLAGFRQQVLDLWQLDGVLTQAQAEALVASVDAIFGVVGSPCSSTAALAAAALVPFDFGLDTAPAEFALSAAYPNPFNPTTTISFDLPKASFVTLSVYSILGQQVAQLVNEQKSPGRYTVSFDASTLSSGIYLYRLQTDSYMETMQMTLIK